MLTERDNDQPTFATYLAASVILGTPEPMAVPDEPPASAPQQQRAIAADGLADIVLSATSPDDLRDALDEALTSDHFRAHRSAANVIRCTQKFRSVPGGPTLSELEARVRLLGEESANLLAEADRVKMAILVAFARAEATALAQAIVQPTDVDPLSDVIGAHLPVPVKRNLLAMWHGLMAKIAIRKILRENLTVPPWKALALAQADLLGAQAGARGFELVWPGLLSGDARPDRLLDVQDTHERYTAKGRFVERLCEDARASGGNVYFPNEKH